MVKILFVLDTLKGGGAQRATINIIKNLDRSRFEPQLLLINGKNTELLDFLPSHTAIYDLKVKKVRYALFRLIWKIKELQPDLIFATPTYISELTYLALKFFKNRPPLIARCASIESKNIKSESFLTKILARKTYSRVDGVVALTKTMKRDLIENYNVNINKIETIPNMVDSMQINEMSKEPVTENFFTSSGNWPLIVSMGRLSEEKGFELLLHAFAKFRKKQKARLAVIGEGKLKSKLNEISIKLGIKDDVYFTGFKINPYKYLSKGDVYVLPSLWEGFPNALVEAMACGIPVIATNCFSGPSGIITSGLNGILVPIADVDGMAGAIEKVLKNFEYREELSKNAKERIRDFAPENVVKMYERMFIKIAGPRKRVLFVINSIYGGGAERQLQYILKYIDQKKINPVLFILKSRKNDENYIPADIPVIKSKLKNNPVSGILIYLKFIRTLIKVKPDYLISFMWKTNLFSIMGSYMFKIPTIISERAYTRYIIKDYSYIWKFLLTHIYPFAAKIVAVSEDTKDSLIQNFCIKNKKIQVINNGIDLKYIEEESNKYVPDIKDYVLSCGRFEHQKGFDILIEAMAGIDKKLVIIGEGKLKNFLQEKAKQMDVNMILPGYKKNPYPYFKKADLFVLASRFEGFSNVLIEAMACGTPVIAADCPGGTREIIEDGINGLLVNPEDKNALAASINKLLKDQDLRLKLIKNAKLTVEKFAVEKMVREYEKLLN